MTGMPNGPRGRISGFGDAGQGVGGLGGRQGRDQMDGFAAGLHIGWAIGSGHGDRAGEGEGGGDERRQGE